MPDTAQTASAAPAAATPTLLTIRGMTCASCQVHVQRALAAVPGVLSANVNLMAHTASVAVRPGTATEALVEAVQRSGYEASVPSESTTALEAEPSRLGLRAICALLAGLIAMTLSMPLMMASPDTSDPLLSRLSWFLAPAMPSALMAVPPQLLRWVLCALAVSVMLFAAQDVYGAAFRAARHRATNMNTLVAIGTLAAFVASFAATVAPRRMEAFGLGTDVYYEAVVLILAFLLTGRWLEARARTRAHLALRGFSELEAVDARLLTVSPDNPSSDYGALPETLLPVNAIEAGDLIRILPGDRIPLDGLILHGRSSVDESMLTGEPLPASRTVGDTVASGTLNLDGALVVRATAVGADSTLAQMQRLLVQAQSTRAPMQRLADRASAVFVPSVLALAAISFAVWAIAENAGRRHLGYGHAFAIAIAVLIIACPCAMGLAVPAAVTVALGRAAQMGLLIKGGEALERLATVDTIALDKTGTLTEGRPHIAAFLLQPDATLEAATLLAYAAAAERLSTHPLAHAVVAYEATQPGITPQIHVNDLNVLPGVGLTATVADHRLTLGNASVLQEPAPASPAHLAHATPLYLLLDDHLEATLYALDQLRASAIAAVTEIQQLGLSTVLLTGDTSDSAAPIAHAAGITDIHAGLLPAEKLAAIRHLQQQGKKVAMAGDGINDAAALAQADASFAMAEGTGLAREAGDVLLLHNDLRLLPAGIRLARRATRIMRQNLGWAVGYNLLGLPIAAGALYPHFHILLSPILASIAMALSSVSVLANSLRLRNA